MGQRHNRRRLRSRLGRNEKWSATDYRIDAEEGATLVHCLYSHEDLTGSYEMPHDHEPDSTLDMYRSGHLCTLDELQEAQRRMFGGEVGDEELVALGILSDDREGREARPSPSTPRSADVLPCFRSRSRSRPGKTATSTPKPDPAPGEKDNDGEDDDWELTGSEAWESGSEAWELLGDDS